MVPTRTIATITSLPAMRALLPEWQRLFYACGAPNPFAHPLWLIAWARHFIRPSKLFVVTMRTSTGALIGVAPFYQRWQRLGPGVDVRRLQLLGCGQHPVLTELPQVLLMPGHVRGGLRDLICYLSAHHDSWDWVELTLAPEHGWFEPQWLPTNGPGRGSALLHRATRPCVVVPLPATVEDWRAGLKRNARESVRRAVNRLARGGHDWLVATPGDVSELGLALDDLVALHRARAAMAGMSRHPDLLSDATDRAFLRDVARELFHAGHLTPCLLRVDGRPVAARLLLHANGSTFFSLSGMDPGWGAYSVGALLLAECLRLSIARGEQLANLSIGPDVAKLRWGEQLRLYQDIVLVGPRRRSRMALALLWQGRFAANLFRRSGG